MEQEQKRILEAVFGDSSDDEENPKWELIKQITGLYLCTHFLSFDQQSSLISAIKNEGWFTEESHNQAMRFGDLPAWAVELSEAIRVAVSSRECMHEYNEWETCDLDKEVCPLPSNLLWREPLFDQLIVNTYQPGEGICAHVDLMRFEDGIAIVSLESTCVMQFTRGEREADNYEKGESKEDHLITKIPILLTPGSLIIMSGEARYLWKHEINRNAGFQVWKGTEISQKKRTSVTLRKLGYQN
ncbi:hypothetical protein GIB67_015118 [Kingdonia uniflora]|uniref:Fe2OG dioxygenase domain-containing protein n=1 Tax=Kingdonia uniflora TaxID=39325 RepID=A0A7J7LJB5_9MAGN|nr:hypothetical protein GIB67_015118 [Kingdonia uniflora]